MIEEPSLEPKSVFSFVNIDGKLGLIGFSEEAQQRFKNCKKVYIILAVGDTGRSKSTTLSMLVNPTFLPFIKESSRCIFKVLSGPDPVTGFERDDMNFPCIGPILLSNFLQRYKKPFQPGDEEIALIFVDSQGTNALLEKSRGLILSTTILSSVLGLRLILTDRGRPTNVAYDNVKKGIALNVFMNHGDTIKTGYDICVLNPDVYDEPENDEFHHKQKLIDREKYTNEWLDNFEILRMSENFLFLMRENPFSNIEGFYETMGELVEWIAQLARKNYQSWSTISSTMNASVQYFQQYMREHPDEDLFEIFIDKLLTSMISSQLDSQIPHIYPIIESSIQQKIKDMTATDLININKKEFCEQMQRIGIEKFDEVANSIWNKIKNDFPYIYKEKIIEIMKFSDIKSYEIIADTRNETLMEIEDKLSLFAEQLQNTMETQAKNQMDKIALDKFLLPNTCNALIDEYESKIKNKFDEKIQGICQSISIQNIFEKKIDKIKNISLKQIKSCIITNCTEKCTLAREEKEKQIQKAKDDEEKKKLNSEVVRLNNQIQELSSSLGFLRNQIDQLKSNHADDEVIIQKKDEENKKILKMYEREKEENERLRRENNQKFEEEMRKMRESQKDELNRLRKELYVPRPGDIVIYEGQSISSFNQFHKRMMTVIQKGSHCRITGVHPNDFVSIVPVNGRSSAKVSKFQISKL